MLRLIPRPLHRAAYRLAHSLRKLWWRCRRPMLHGVSVLAKNDAGEMLLVRLSYGNQLWQWPGGGAGRDEDPVAAARREFAEETGLKLYDAYLLGQRIEKLHGATNIVHVVAGRAEGTARPDRREIVAAQWCDPGSLPQDRSVTVDRRLELLEQR